MKDEHIIFHVYATIYYLYIYLLIYLYILMINNHKQEKTTYKTTETSVAHPQCTLAGCFD